MTPERYKDLIETYGAQPARWPHERRAEAERLTQCRDPDMTKAFESALALDVELSTYLVSPADADLLHRIVASGPSLPWWRRISRRHRLWLSGAVLAGAGMSGMAAGVIGISLVVPPQIPASSVAGSGEGAEIDTAFGEFGVNWSEQ